MDMNLLNSLSNQQKQEYMAISRVFGTEGWQILSNYYKSLADNLVVAGANAGSWDDVVAARATRIAYENFANLEESTEAHFTQVAEEVKLKTEDEERYE